MLTTHSDQIDAIRSEFEQTGLVRGHLADTGHRMDSFASIVRELGEIVAHPHAKEDGSTSIAPDPSLEGKRGYLGMTTSALHLHTDGPGTPKPALGLAMICERPAPAGGTATFLSAEMLVRRLQEQSPELLRALTEPESAVFMSADGSQTAPVLKKTEGGRWVIRLRLDDKGYYNYHIANRMSTLLEVISDPEHTINMQEGDYYIVNNRRWLHGRTSFSGDRLMRRYLFQNNSLGQ